MWCDWFRDPLLQLIDIRMRVLRMQCGMRAIAVAIGIAVATKYFKGYFPIAHEGGGNMDEEKVVKLFGFKALIQIP